MDTSNLSIQLVFRILRRHKIIILSVFSVVVTIAAIRAYSAIPIYRASAKMLIQRDNSNPLNPYERFYWEPYFIATQSQIIKSTAVGLKVVENLELEKRYDSFFNAQPKTFNPISDLKKWVKNLLRSIVSITGRDKRDAGPEKKTKPVKNPTGDEAQNKPKRIAEAIAGGIKIAPVQKSSVISLSYHSSNPEFATIVVNSVAQAYIDQILEMKMETSGHTIKWMASKAEEERKHLEESEKALQEYMRANDIVTVENRITGLPGRLEQLSSDLTTAENELKELETLSRKIKNISVENALTIPDIVNNNAIVNIRNDLLQADQKIVELSKKYGPKHPVFIRTKEERKTLNQKYRQEIKRVIKTIQNRYDLAKSREKNLRSSLKRTRAEASSMNERFVQYGMLKRTAEANRMLYETLIKRLKEKSLTEEKNTVSVWMVENARRPGSPISPNIRRSIMIGVMLGLVLGCGLAFLIEFLDSSIKTPELLEESIPVPVLGTVIEGRSGKIPIHQIMLKSGNAPMAENYKSIRTAIMLSQVDNPPKIIVLSSVVPQEGKTTTSLNLALALSQTQKKVLLIDADLRRPQIHKLLGLNNKTGLSSLLAGSNVSKAIQTIEGTDLRILCSGPIPPNPSELLSSAKLKSQLKQLRGYFDYIIIDSPPVMAVSDSLILGSIADATILIARAGKTTYDQLKRGIKSFQDFEAPILGVVINRMHHKKHGYYSYNRYDYYYSASE